MSYKDAKAKFEKQIAEARELADGAVSSAGSDAVRISEAHIVNAALLYADIICGVLFEINGNLDSLAVSYRELVNMQKERGGNANKKA